MNVNQREATCLSWDRDPSFGVLGNNQMQLVPLLRLNIQYCAIIEGAKEATWLQTFLQEIGAIKECFTILHVDNQSYLKIAKNLVFHARTNHIEAHYHFIREKVISFHVPTSDQFLIFLPNCLITLSFRNLESRQESKI